MNIAVFLTFDYSFKTWVDSGTLDKELRVYQELSSKYNINFTFFSYGDESESELIKSYKNFNVIPLFNKIKTKNKLFKLFVSFLIPFQHYKKLKTFDLLHQHQLLGSWVVIISKFLIRKPILIRTGYDMYEFSQHTKKRFSFTKIFFYILTFISLKMSDTYTVTSKCDLKFVEKTFNLKNKTIVVRPNWIIPNKLTPLNKRFNNKVLSVGRLDNQKNYFELIKQFPENFDYELTIIGNGIEKENLLKEIRLNNYRVKIINNLPNEEILKEMNKYKYFISSSKFEGNPKTILEAMSCGCIVIVSKIKNHLEIIDGTNGELFNLNNMEIKKILDELNKNIVRQEELSKKALDTVIENNLLDKIIKKMFEDYKFLVR